jgi:hypothetical protein
MRISTHFPFTPTTTSIRIPSVFISAHALLDVHGTNNFDQRRAFVSKRTLIASGVVCAVQVMTSLVLLTWMKKNSVACLGMTFKGKLI